MPKISKVRIVNFTYNDGNRLIADELFNFSKAEDDDALNVLINLANGGGKSVLVQLMMQPIIPKAKVAGRKINSFFKKNTDHCYILLEWFKDNSNEKLLTGISITSREVSANEDDDSRGRSIKYYTFYTNYSSDDFKYSISNIPLSANDHGRFIPADFDEVRRICKKSNGELQYYTSDDSHKWQKKLLEYGIVQDEWRMIEKLNSEEGGLGKFFGEFKTSDSLIDNLLIPTIEGTSLQKNSQEDSSLSTMFLSYAEDYYKKEDIIKERETYDKFIDDLHLLKPKADDLWMFNEEVNNCLESLFAFSDALQLKISEIGTEKENCNKKIIELKEKQRVVQWEKISEQYYSKQSELEKSQKELDIVSDKLSKLKDEHNTVQHKIEVLECAEIYKNLKQIENEISAKKSLITQRENNSDSSKNIAILKYSSYVAIKKELEKVASKIEEFSGKLKELKSQIDEKEIKKNATNKNVQECKTSFDRSYGKLETAKEYTDNDVANLGLELFRRLDGFYSKDEIDYYQSQTLDEVELIKSSINKNETDLKVSDERKNNIISQRFELNNNILQLKQELESDQKEIESYKALESKIESVCNEHNIDFSLRFTDRIKTLLNELIKQNRAEYANITRQISICEDEISAVTSGYLHIPQQVINYLNETGLSYITCEKYLLQQIDECKLSKEKCLEILENYPTVAYGILMDESQAAKIKDYRQEWLPAMIPIFSFTQMDKILKIENRHIMSIAFYSKEYFSDKSSYKKQIEKELLDKKNACDLLNQNEQHLKEQLQIVSDFNYNDSWLIHKNKSVENTNIKTSDLANTIEQLKVEENNLIKRISELNNENSKLKSELNSIESKIQKFDNLYNLIKKEANCEKERYSFEIKYKELSAKLLEEENELISLQHIHLETDFRHKSAVNSRETLLKALNDVEDCTQTEIVDEYWEDLYSKYNNIMQSVNDELSKLKFELDKLQNKFSSYRKKLLLYSIDEDEYSKKEYSEEELFNLKSTDKLLEKESNKLSYEEAAFIDKVGVAKGELKSIDRTLADYESPLPKSQISGNFEEREKSLNKEINSTSKLINSYDSKIQLLYSSKYKLSVELEKHIRPYKVNHIDLLDNFETQKNNLISKHKEMNKKLDSTLNEIKSFLSEEKDSFQNTSSAVLDAVNSMIDLINSETRGDKYFTFTEYIKNFINNSQLELSRIDTDLKDFENSKSDLVHQCTLQGDRIYRGLKNMASSSKVEVFKNKEKKQMICFDIPKEIDTNVAQVYIEKEIDKGIDEVVEAMKSFSDCELEKKKIAERIVGSKNLLRKYINKDSIEVKAYKIDQNPENSGYRKWRDTQINNSGAEKFVVYFAVILSLINYTRGSFGENQGQGLKSALILDNPFGATSSKHILEPMFKIAKHFKVQMICLSDINKADIINCFEIVIKVIIKKRPLSNNELLTHEGNEEIEHGYYRSQITMF